MFWSTHGGHTHLSATRAWPHKSFSLFLFELTIRNTSGVCRSVALGAGWANSHDYFLCILNIHTSKRSDGWSVKASVSCSRQSLSWGWSSLQNHAWPKLYPAPRMVLFVQCQSIFLLQVWVLIQYKVLCIVQCYNVCNGGETGPFGSWWGHCLGRTCAPKNSKWLHALKWCRAVVVATKTISTEACTIIIDNLFDNI